MKKGTSRAGGLNRTGDRRDFGGRACPECGSGFGNAVDWHSLNCASARTVRVVRLRPMYSGAPSVTRCKRPL